jgi:hypothetical protein
LDNPTDVATLFRQLNPISWKHHLLLRLHLLHLRIAQQAHLIGKFGLGGGHQVGIDPSGLRIRTQGPSKEENVGFRAAERKGIQ